MDQAKDLGLFAAKENHQVAVSAITRLQELSTRLIQAGHLHSLLKEILAASTEIANTDKGNIQFVDPETNTLRIVIHQGLSKRFVEHFGRQGLCAGCEKAKEEKTRVIVEDVMQVSGMEPADLETLMNEGIRSFQCTPLVSREGRVLGMLNNHFSTPHLPGELELRFLDLLGRMAADLIERKQVEEKLRISYNELERRVKQRTAELDSKNVELQNRADQLARLASEITVAEEQERHRLANILHDHLQQILVAAKLELTVLSRKLVDSEHQALVEDLSGLMEEAVRESKNITVELSPPILHEAGLHAGLEWLVRRMQTKYSMDIKLDLASPLELKRDDVSILCFQSVRELLFNSFKHSGVKAASVCVHKNDKHLEITVSDKGRGFDPEDVWQKTSPASGGFGLLSIRERLNLLGGHFEIDSQPGSGSVFRLTIPHAALTPSDVRFDPVRDARRGAIDAQRKIRILLADDHTVMRRGLASMLRQEPDLEIVGEAEDGLDAVEKARHLLPDVILMDFSMPRMNGLDATRHICGELPQTRVIGLSMFDEAERAAAMINAGALAYACKSERPEVILRAIRNAFAGTGPENSASHQNVHGPQASLGIADAARGPAHANGRAKKATGKNDSSVVQSSLFD